MSSHACFVCLGIWSISQRRSEVCSLRLASLSQVPYSQALEQSLRSISQATISEMDPLYLSLNECAKSALLVNNYYSFFLAAAGPHWLKTEVDLAELAHKLLVFDEFLDFSMISSVLMAANSLMNSLKSALLCELFIPVSSRASKFIMI